MGLFFRGQPDGSDFPTTDPTYQRILNNGTPQAIANAKLAAQGGGILDAIVRGVANGSVSNTADMAAAAADATIPIDSGSSVAPSWSQRYSENLNNQYLRSRADVNAHPIASTVASFAGSTGNPLNGYISSAAPNIGSAITGGAVSRALSGDIYALRMHDSGQAQLNDILRSIALGIPGAAIGYAFGNRTAPNPSSASDP